ncbi:hydrogenase [Burkholderia sp. JP2-270]|uniref:Coenzyme F420 hydrogenase/dehydrogenase, beta subunit C-terminal domain n=1 Tax=Burkholderia sp. JP2-270 TaxID=2217913 RepID=UPI000DA3F2EB|nr:Coenzyme F420 hydrogenase/dehydrogenase, beta subunit C-terminal domain [Burkholderia sp. JP2-270]AWV02723.1 hydrogenase [Burkholderia sp. JP2-270]
MSIVKLKQEVLEPALCAGCGACGLVCPKQLIRFDKDRITPVLDFDTDACATCDAPCHAVCPGADPATDASEEHLFGRRRTVDERWLGIVGSVLGATSTSEEIRARSASGGAATALLLESRRYLDVKHVLSMGRDAAEGWRAAPVVSNETEHIVGNAQSTYQMAPYLVALRAVYEATPGDNVAVVGLACHIQALRKLQRLDSALGRWARERIVLLVETACSSNTLPAGTSSIVSGVLGLELDEVVDVKYREGAYPGNFQTRTRDGRAHVVQFWEILGKLKENKTHRCLTCGDWMSGLADISVSDGDPNIFDASVNGATIAKHARLIVRTPLGGALIEHAVEQGVLERWAIDLSGFNLGLERKRNRRRHYELSALPIPKGPGAGDAFERDSLRSDDELINPETYKR